jgi:hypothetical protein
MATFKPTQVSTNHKLIIAAAWLVSMTVGLMWFAVGNKAPFMDEAQMAFFSGESLSQHLQESPESANHQTGSNTTIEMIHFYNPACACSEKTSEHIERITQEFQNKDVHYKIVSTKEIPKSADIISTFGEDVEITLDPSINHYVPSTPATAIMNSAGELAYFGPYSLGINCGDDRFIENTIESIISEEFTPTINVTGLGCFCSWI